MNQEAEVKIGKKFATSFLLPSLGVEVAGAAKALENLKEDEFYCSNFTSLNACGFSHPSKEKKLRLTWRPLRLV